MTSTAGIGTVTTEQFDAANNQNSKTVIDSVDDSISGVSSLVKPAGSITIKTVGGNVSLGDNTVLNGTTVSRIRRPEQDGLQQ
ncbi:MAG: hypothetical protein ACLT8E_01945 [Akkermansia sp.]